MDAEAAATPPEHIDAFAAFLQNPLQLVGAHHAACHSNAPEGVLYDYVQGELWLIAARIGRPAELGELLPTARGRPHTGTYHLPMRRGLVAFIMSCRRAGVYAEPWYSRFPRADTLHSIAYGSYLADADFRPNGIVVDLSQEQASARNGVGCASRAARAFGDGSGCEGRPAGASVRGTSSKARLDRRSEEARLSDQIGDILRHR